MRIRKGNPFNPFHLLFQGWKVLLWGVFILSLLFFLSQLNFSQYFPIRTIKVYGANRIDHQEIQEMIQPLVRSGFFGINIEYIRDRLLQMPWISEIFVRRNWPDQLAIIILEKHPVARWNGQHLLSEAGEIFLPKQETYPANLPQFEGPEGKQMLMLQYFAEINRVLMPIHAKISDLELTPYSTWKLKLDNGITLQVGHKDILTRLSHFVKVYPKIVGEHTTDVDYIDLRYSNGVAVRWKGESV